MKSYVFPGQGAQFVGMGKETYDNSIKAKELYEKANDILGFRITDIMFNGSDEQLKQTKVTQPAIFLNSVIKAIVETNEKPDFVAGHSLGEFSALVVGGYLSFEEGLKLVSIRANEMQKACELNKSTMAAVIGMKDENKLLEILENIDEIVIAANFNCPGQVVISGSIKGIQIASEKLKEAGALNVIPLNVSGAFHSAFMEPARIKLAEAINNVEFLKGNCPIFQNVDAKAHTDKETIKENLIKQLTSPVLWTQTVKNMIEEGTSSFTEIGPGKVLCGLIKKINRKMEIYNK